MILLMALSLVDFKTINTKKRIQLFETFRKRILTKELRWPFLLLLLYFVIVLISFWQTQGDFSYFFAKLRIKLPFLLLPLAFLGLPAFNKDLLHKMFYFLIAMMTFLSLLIGVKYALNFAEYNELLRIGKSFPVPGNHIRFSNLLAIAIIASVYLIANLKLPSYKKSKTILVTSSIVMIAFIHVLSVKTGLLALYFALVAMLLWYMLKTKKYFLGIGMLASIIAMLILSVLFIPSLNQKFAYLRYDLQQYQLGEGHLYGDSGRIVSIKAGWELFKSKPIFGVGAGNLRKATKEYYQKYHPEFEIITPHNQFLYVLTSTGIVGFILFLMAFFGLLFSHELRQNIFFIGFFAFSFILFMIEHSIENAVGVATFIFFLLAIMSHCILAKASS